MYKVLGADNQEYGPASADEIRQWIAQGRANAQTLIQSEGVAGWRPLSTFPEFAAAFPAAPAAHAPYPVYPGYGSPAAGTSGMAITGFIMGLLSLITCFVGPLFSILGLVFSCIGLAQISKQPGRGGRGLAIAGIILSIVGFIVFGFLMLAGMIGSVLQDTQGAS